MKTTDRFLLPNNVRENRSEIRNGQSRDTGNIGRKTQNKDNKNKKKHSTENQTNMSNTDSIIKGKGKGANRGAHKRKADSCSPPSYFYSQVW